MRYLQFILEHKKELTGLVLALHAGLVHFYIVVCHAGGYRSLWRNFQGPKLPPLATKPDKPD